MFIEEFSIIFGLIIPFLSLSISLIVGCFVLFKGSKKAVNRVIAGVAFSSFHYNLFQVLYYFFPAVWIVKLSWLGSIALIPLLVEFPDAVIDNRYCTRRNRNSALFAAAFFALSLPTDWLFQPKLDSLGTILLATGGPLLKVYATVMGWILLRLGYRLVKALRTSPDEMVKRRLEFILLGEVFYCFCAVHDILLRSQVFWIFSFPIVQIATLAFMIIVVYATMRFRLIDVDIVLGVSVYYMLLTMGTAFVYKTVEYFLENYLKNYINIDSWWIQMIPAFVVALMIGPVREVIQRFIDFIFLDPEYRTMKIFRSPNIQFLLLDSRIEELTSLRDEMSRLVESTKNKSSK